MIGLLRRICRECGCEKCDAMHRRAQQAESKVARMRRYVFAAMCAGTKGGQLDALSEAMFVADEVVPGTTSPKPEE